MEQQQLPVIDISPFTRDASSHAERLEVARQMYKACTDTGFFLISNYDDVMPQAQIDQIMNLMQQFFSLPPQEKQKLKGAENRGYVALGEENLSTVHEEVNSDMQGKELGDYKEALDLGREIDPSSPEFGLPFRGPNYWPRSELLGEEWKQNVLQYFSSATKLGHILMRIFALSLSLPEHWFEDKIDKPMAVLRLLHYPPAPVDQARMGCGAHSDYGCCTILAQDNAGGLQLLNKQGAWVNISPIPRTLVINIGDMLQRWTNNTFVSTIHRVVNPSGRHRFSCPFFFEPNFDLMVECIETCVPQGSKPLFPPIKFGDHLVNMYKATYLTASSSSSSPSSSSSKKEDAKQ